jgi:biopolymer transport protein ExbB
MIQIQPALRGITEVGTDWILWLLVALSVLVLAVIIERSVNFWCARDNLSRLESDLDRLVREGNWERLKQRLAESPSYEAKVAAAALVNQGLEIPAAETADQYMQGEIERIKLAMERYLGFLGTVGSNAPFIGLLGTVIGIVGAFRELNVSQGALTEGLMGDIGEALVATAVGLMVALPAIAAFNIFRRIVQTRVSQANALRRNVLGHLSVVQASPGPAAQLHIDEGDA